MSFKDELERICTRVEGALGVVILAEDGIIVERHAIDATIDLELASAEFAGATREMRRGTMAVGAGELDEVLVSSRERLTLLRFIGPGYYLLLFMAPGALVGRGRYELRRAAHALANEFA